VAPWRARSSRSSSSPRLTALLSRPLPLPRPLRRSRRRPPRPPSRLAAPALLFGAGDRSSVQESPSLLARPSETAPRSPPRFATKEPLHTSRTSRGTSPPVALRVDRGGDPHAVSVETPRTSPWLLNFARAPDWRIVVKGTGNDLPGSLHNARARSSFWTHGHARDHLADRSSLAAAPRSRACRVSFVAGAGWWRRTEEVTVKHVRYFLADVTTCAAGCFLQCGGFVSWSDDVRHRPPPSFSKPRSDRPPLRVPTTARIRSLLAVRGAAAALFGSSPW